jgi:hypothetical protein
MHIFSLETDVLTGGLTYLVFWGKLVRGCLLVLFCGAPFSETKCSAKKTVRLPGQVELRRDVAR